MDLDRRGFLTSAATALAALRCRALIQQSDLGDVLFCRISDTSLLDLVQTALNQTAPLSVTTQPGHAIYRYPGLIVSYEPRGENYGITLCGAKATLTIAPHQLS